MQDFDLLKNNFNEKFNLIEIQLKNEKMEQ